MKLSGSRGDLALSLSDDAELLALNRQYAGEDHATDVLSFSSGGDAPVPPDAAQPREPPPTARYPRGKAPPTLLGDIVISVETAARQAKAGGRTLLAELFHLSVHGLAHLQGYDHATKAEEKVMFGWEARLRARVIARGRRRE